MGDTDKLGGAEDRRSSYGPSGNENNTKPRLTLKKDHPSVAAAQQHTSVKLIFKGSKEMQLALVRMTKKKKKIKI